MPTDFSKALNPQQLDVVLHGDGPCLVLAGAGSGKTRTIVYRVAHLLEQGVLPQQILLLTFTNKAANEMLGRVEQLLGRTPQGLWGGTFHHVANRILRRYAPAVGYQSNFTILDEEDACDLLKLCIRDAGVDTTAKRFPAPRVLKAIISLSRNAQRPIVAVVDERHPKFAALVPTIEDIAARYDARKVAANSMDFDDLLVHLLRLLEQQGPRHALAQQFRYVLVDEYQDTNRIQAAIVGALASVHENLLVVGDDAQSIYSFRAAEIENILAFPKAFPGARTFRIETNYRSTPEVLNLANAVIAQNDGQFKKTLQPVRRASGKPKLVQANTMEDEARYVAKHILDLRDNGVPFTEIAVLFRATHLSQFLEMELVKRDIPYDYRGGVRFFERAHIKDVLAFLKVLANPKDEAAWLRVLRMQRGIGDVGALEIIQRIRTSLVSLRGPEGAAAIPAMDWTTADLALPPRLQNGWNDFQGIVRAIMALTEPAALIRAIASGGMYREYLEAEYPDWQERLEDLEQLAGFAGKYEDAPGFLADTSLTELFGAERVGANTSEQEHIVLSTIHQAKGLEWRAVFIIGMTAAAFPNRRALTEEGGVEEERRLFYVAITRTQELLTISYALAGGVESAYLHAPSPFLSEVNVSLMESVGFSRVPFRSQLADDDDGVITVDAMGERVRAHRPTVVWKSDAASKPAQPRKGFLRDVGEL